MFEIKTAVTSQFNKCDKGVKCLTPLSTIFQLQCGSKCDDYSVIE